MTLHIAPGLDLPDELVTQPCAILARRGAGKTYTASVMTEELLGAGLPVVVLDPLGVWWGLRSSADGKKAGLPVTILGGEHGDVPLEPTSGRLIAELVVDQPGGWIIDLSLFESQAAQDRFACDFGERLYRAQRRENTPVHLMVDEAHNFVPQNVNTGRGAGGIGPKMLGAYETLIRQGRARGIGVTLISQRPAVVNKNVLSQVEVLIAGQVTGKIDRDTLTAWAKGWATREQLAEFEGSLASLKVGEVWVWSPQWLEVFQRVRIRTRRTFDSSATPKAGERRVEPRVLAPVDLDVLKERMAATIEKADATDPKKLQARVRELEREIARVRAETPEPECVVETIEVVKQVLPDGVDFRVGQARLLVESALEELQRAESYVTEFETSDDVQIPVSVPGAAHAPLPPALPPSTPAPARAPRHIEQLDGNYRPRAGARRMLEALAEWPNGLTERQLGTLAKVKKTGGTFGTYVSELRRNLLVDRAGRDLLVITAAGLELVGGARPPTSSAEARAYWRSKFTGGAKRMYDLLVERYPQWYDRGELADAAKITITGGTFGTYLSRLRSNNLIEENGDELRAHSDLFMGQTAG